MNIRNMNYQQQHHALSAIPEPH